MIDRGNWMHLGAGLREPAAGTSTLNHEFRLPAFTRRIDVLLKSVERPNLEVSWNSEEVGFSDHLGFNAHLQAAVMAVPGLEAAHD
jgi:hypothetical protein